MTDEIVAERRKKCWAYVCYMRDEYPHLSTQQLISKWFDENPLICDKKHLSGVVPGRTLTRDTH